MRLNNTQWHRGYQLAFFPTWDTQEAIRAESNASRAGASDAETCADDDLGSSRVGGEVGGWVQQKQEQEQESLGAALLEREELHRAGL
ncbi:MAG TPA: hypothetical protein VK638_23030 [Edaphobacter sp.]|nr:hypothetical protein [Edaphobacter sp.]